MPVATEVCMSCSTEGIVCPGMGAVEVLPGYSSAANLSVFRCRSAANCPGGPPGDTCAEGREGVSCARCAVGMRPSGAGACVPCETHSTGAFAASCVCSVLLCALLYGVFEQNSKSQPGYLALLVAISTGLLIGMMQQLSVMGMLDVAYPDPLYTFVKVMKVVAFDVEEFLSLNCIGTVQAFAHFAAKLSTMLVFMLLIILLHVAFVVARHGARFGERKPVLLSVLGALGMAFYTSVTVTILQPFQCIANPNGKWTVSTYEDVTCWSDDEDGTHGAMLSLAVVALSFPVALFVGVVVLLRRLPLAVRAADVEFLRAYGFLFFRFRPQVPWYVIVIMSRSLCIGIVPVVPSATGQIYVLQAALVCSLGIVVRVRPWRVQWLNQLDILFGAMTLQFLLVTALVAVEETPHMESVGWVCMFTLTAMLAAVPVFLLVSAFKRFGAVDKKYEFFLCHRRGEAGAFARWLKMELAGQPKIKGGVFLEADHLGSLHQLLGYIADDVKTLAILGTRSIYFRPWCIGEMCTAHRHGVDSVILAMPGYQRPDVTAVREYERRVTDLGCLTENGIGVESINATLEAFSAKPVIAIPQILGAATMSALASTLAMGRRDGLLDSNHDAPVRSRTLIIADMSDPEANAAAHVLEKLLVQHTFGSVDGIPRVLAPGQHLPAVVDDALVVFTTGCFSQRDYDLYLLDMSERGVQMLPVIMDDEFCVPNREALNLCLTSWVCAEDVAEKVADIVMELFKAIAITISARRASASVLEVASQTLGERLEARRQALRKRARRPQAGRAGAPEALHYPGIEGVERRMAGRQALGEGASSTE
mmetsp:Transcript_15708/g.45074  ORF Transcript_15708/g.45074 Transcript_15708/m.45074 type:complete len:820 (+) Transcript_15708:1-2460(+)